MYSNKDQNTHFYTHQKIGTMLKKELSSKEACAYQEFVVISKLQ